jgi:two-component system chemotaxis response regulator CheB
MSIRVLLVDDSPTFRALCRAQLSAAGFEVIGEAQTGREAIEATARDRPDVVLMDVEMPEMGGYEATREIMDRSPTPVVVVSAPDSGRGAVLSVEALEAGALAAMPKPPGPDHPEFDAQWRRLARTLRTMAAVRVVRRRRARFSKPPTRQPRKDKARIVALAASTGGPAALLEVLSALPPGFPVPILLVQHIGPEFVGGFARWLDAALGLSVVIAEEGQQPRAGRVHIAPAHGHLRVRGDVIEIGHDPPVGGFRPSANALFASIAESHGPEALGVILTGMGRDGLSGLQTLHARGGFVVAQDEETSVVYSMPGNVVRAGIAHEVLPVNEIAGFILGSVR